MAIFGGAQTLETSGFLAVYLAGYIVNDRAHKNTKTVLQFFDAFSWAGTDRAFPVVGSPGKRRMICYRWCCRPCLFQHC